MKRNNTVSADIPTRNRPQLVVRAPQWMQKAGLGWLFRLAVEPHRLWKRHLIGNIHFSMLALRQWIMPGAFAGTPLASIPE
jgi:hypothetical protein